MNAALRLDSERRIYAAAKNFLVRPTELPSGAPPIRNAPTQPECLRLEVGHA
jgi:hypothetical protein